MKSEKLNLLRWSALLLSILSFIWVAGCSKNNQDIVGPQANSGNNQAIEQIVLNDPSITSFEPNYNEEDAMSFALGKVATAIYPLSVGQHMYDVSRDFTVTYKGDTAYGKLTKTFKGVLIIAGSYTKPAAGKPGIDTVITKDFTTTITRNVKLLRVGDTTKTDDGWKIIATSLPEGGTLTSNVNITKMTLFMPDGDTLSITSPKDYYLYRQPGKWKQMPSINRNSRLTVRVELTSAYADTDFVTITHGAVYDNFKRGMHREKVKFHLVSSTPQNGVYNKIYEATWTTKQFMGYFHAVVNAYPKGAIFDDAAKVETDSWGLPYIVK
ncbi:MAG: hypothetical protein ACM3S2_03795 [Ignavibacteriales bacterium]